ncbi:hypothetical protein BDZ94DRAFT_1274779 [Collybia nuda]|uniref:FAD/NAD(P)-binding domain-containing protein n=1 Tax=Collybia nuda TaxID=64659 RepID=A0A9P5XSJ9_9AGAR|nr:hypothetical protein BDZ94DRAFT_1274779 [Collybia nuda]
MARKVKVAVVGSGLAGLTAAYLLTNPTDDTEDNNVTFDLHLFEKASMLGMDSSSVSLPVAGQDKSWRVDVPMRSFQGGYYPQLISLYKRLGVAFRQADFSYSFSLFSPSTQTQHRQINTTMIYNGGSGRSGLGMPALLDEPYHRTKGQSFLVRALTKAWTVGLFLVLTSNLVLCYLRMIFYAMPIWRSKSLERTTFAEWAASTVPTGFVARLIGMDKAWRDYTHTILVPLFSAVCTAPEQDVLQHPVEEILDYIWLTLGTHHYVASYGVQDVVARLTSNIENIHLSSTISAILPDQENPHLASIQCITPNGTITHAGFHHIIFATQASHAVPLISSYASYLSPANAKRQTVEDQVRCLKTFRYCPTVVINHTDGSLLPDHPRDRRELNLILMDPEHNKSSMTCKQFDYTTNIVPPTYTMATHVLTPPEGYPPNLPTIYQTTNPIIPAREDCVFSVAKLERAVLTVNSKEALKGLYHEEGRKWWQCAGQANSCLGTLQGAGRLSGMQGPGIWICGSFAHAGIPLLEGCVVSARTVVEQGVYRSEGMEAKTSPW